MNYVVILLISCSCVCLITRNLMRLATFVLLLIVPFVIINRENSVNTIQVLSVQLSSYYTVAAISEL